MFVNTADCTAASVYIKPTIMQWGDTNCYIETTNGGGDWSAIRTVKYKSLSAATAGAFCTDCTNNGTDDWAVTNYKYNWDACTGAVDVEVVYRASSANCVSWPSFLPKQLTPEERIREIIASRQAPRVFVRGDYRKALPHTNDIRELRARETLHRVIGDEKYQRLIRDGFVSVRGKDGLFYQIFPGHGITCVFNNGQMVERLCVVLQGNFPPTDSIIMRYLMLLNNPVQFRSFAIKHSVIQRQRPALVMPDGKSLPEIYAELKKIA